ncbi:hypothetical protein [Xanthomonas sp. 3075]|uniref:hypothetical protein n=1 Tax=Xanthomonas sp. 3075 TaxID=3035315 RepID=UPI00161AF985|nr:hypothetical protein [Xanthomonas sp. 3075]MBB4131838.1 hypothetical protein [Xanthomonas sp. 3075]
MLKHVLVAAVLTVLPTACFATPKEAHDQDAVSLTKELRNSRHFWLYFVTRTEDYSLTNDQIKVQSTIRIYRVCGANCANTLDLVVQHLRNAQPIACIPGPGMENVLLELSSGEHVVYSHAGLQLKLNNHCYLSSISINKVLDQTNYIFK